MGISENHNLVKTFSNSAIFADLITLNDDSFDAVQYAHQLATGHRTKVGIVLNYECPGSDSFVSKVSLVIVYM